MDAFRPPAEFDGYRLVRLLGRGGMGEVHLAHDTLLDRHVAIKFIASSQADHEARQRFLVEARAIARLSHPNVVSVYRVGEVEGYPYLVSEFVRGLPLDSLNLPLSGEQTLSIAHDVSCALAAAHQRGVLHRDIKPANAILSDDGPVKLLDFGIAKLLEPAASSLASAICPSVMVESSPVAQTVVDSQEALESMGVDATEVGATPSEVEALLCPDATVPNAGLLDGLTDPGVALGTPRYMAPEVWRGEGGTFRSDVYSYGALIYTLATGSPPISGKSAAELYLRVQFETPRPLREVAPQLEPRLCDIVHRCLERDPQKRFASGGELRAAVADLVSGDRDPVLAHGNPYRGLLAFEAEHRGVFFGRDSEIRMILDRLTNEAFVLVAGDSGVGKSSLCRAGVLPRLAARLGVGDSLEVARIVPGRHPVAALASVLSPVLGRDEEDLSREMREDPAGLARQVRQATAESGCVLLVDQLEELVTLSEEPEASTTCEFLSWLAEPSNRLRVLATVRGDFLSRVAQLPMLGESVARALYFLRPLSPERIREVITGPAATRGKRFESEDLVEDLVASTERAQGGLPLLQFALAELWDACNDNDEVIRRDTLRSIGGVEGALARHADSVLSSMTPVRREVARRVLCSLVTGEGTRARLLFEELGAADSVDISVLESLVRGRLLVASQTPAGTTHEIAHEVLVRGWPTLSGWLASNAKERAVRERLVQASREWDRLGRKKELLWARAQLAEAHALSQNDLGALEVAFIDASKVRNRWAFGFSLALATFVVGAIVAVFVGATHRAHLALEKKIDAELAAGREEFAKAKSRAGQAEDEKREALQAFDEGQDVRAEERWQSYREFSAAAEELLAAAGRRFEAALLLDGTRTQTLNLMADWLVERFLLAEQAMNAGAQADLLQRLTLYDTDGSRGRALSVRAHVQFDIRPSDAQVELFVYGEASADSRLEPSSLGVHDPLASLELEPGSYLAVVTAPGRVKTSHPFVVGRGERLVIGDDPPMAEDVPAGFVYVPPGRFLYGSAAADSQRRDFFRTVPLHQVETGAYLIAQRETTYRDWLEYVRSVPEEHRASVLPRVEKGGFQGALSLSLSEDGRYRLSFAPTETMYTALEGESFQYEGREVRVTQNWLDLPVSGISVADAEAFAAFLHASGKVPGARLCTEYEWERATRGADGREYPHGHRLLPTEANFDDTYGKVPSAMGPDEVGSYPASDSPLGIQDAAGNVWEWTKTKTGGYAARGGSFYFGANSARAPDREVTEPSFRDVSVGLRLCATVR